MDIFIIPVCIWLVPLLLYIYESMLKKENSETTKIKLSLLGTIVSTLLLLLLSGFYSSITKRIKGRRIFFQAK